MRQGGQEPLSLRGVSAAYYKLLRYGPKQGGLVELLWEGPAGAGGKTRTTCKAIYDLCYAVPNLRVLVCRKIRADLASSVLTMLEDDIMPENDPVRIGPSRLQRREYCFPNGSRWTLAGFDDPNRFRSSDWDIVYVCEANEITLDDWELAVSRLRHGRLGFHPAIAETNPGAPSHWLNQRAIAGRMLRYVGRYEDNPRYWDVKKGTWTREGKDYVCGVLESLTGVRLRRYRYGEWCAAEGAIYPNFDPQIHCIEGEIRRSDSGKISLDVPKWERTIEIDWCFAAVDWGWRDPGVLGVWGVDANGVMYRLKEIYRINWDINQWADAAAGLRDEFDIRRFTCDPARPENIRVFNKRMSGTYLGREELAQKAANAVEAGLSMVRERFQKNKVFFLRSGRDRDPELASGKRPTCTEDEIPGYVFADQKDGQPARDVPAQGQADHGNDMTRYACAFLDDHDWRPAPAENTVPPESAASILRHDLIHFE
jgi:phage terminase large subunit